MLETTHFFATKLPSEKFVINHIFVLAFKGIMIIPTLLLIGVAVITIFKSSQPSSTWPKMTDIINILLCL